MNEKNRLLSVLWGEAVDRPPVICPGGMMSACVTEIIENINENYNLDSNAMAIAANKIFNETGFENLGVPFAMVAEAEPLGIKIDNGSKLVEERVIEYNTEDLETIMEKYNVIPEESNRMGIVIEAVSRLKNDRVPVIGNITGHISTASSVVDPLVIFKMLRKQPKMAYSFLKYINEYLIEYARGMVKAGADIITISDPSATGEILGGKNFENFAVPFYKEIVREIHALNVPVIIHICGRADTIIDGLNTIGANALSFDSIMSMRYVKSRLNTKLMGNISTQLLHTGDREKIVSITNNCIASGVDIVSPACGLSMATPINKLRTMTEYVKEGSYL